MTIELPYPPSVNTLWRSAGGRNILSEAGRAYRRQGLTSLLFVSKADRACWPFTGPLAVEIYVHPPDRRRRDLDNIPKAVLDLLTHGGVYQDDSQIDRLLIQRQAVFPGGLVRVEVAHFNLDQLREERL